MIPHRIVARNRPGIVAGSVDVRLIGFLFMASLAIGAIIALADYRYYHRVHEEYPLHRASLAEQLFRAAQDNIDFMFRDDFRGLDILPGRDRGELGVRSWWWLRDQTVAVVFDVELWRFHEIISLQWACFREFQSAGAGPIPDLPRDNAALRIEQIMRPALNFSLPDASGKWAPAGTRRHMIIDVAVTDDRVVLGVGLPDYRDQAYVRPPGWPGVGDPECGRF